MKNVIVFFILLFFTGCSVSNTPQVNSSDIINLHQLLKSLNKNNNIKESSILANEMFQKAKFLKKSYALVKPPLFHNFLVNIGIKKRGLCWHFAYDMLAHAKSLNLNSFDYYIGGANINDYWEEHNSLIVTCKDCKFSNGIVLDPWRNSGKLFFAKIKNDTQYNWTQRGEKRN